jgi:hypothetical protein
MSRAEQLLQLVIITSRVELTRYHNEPTRVEPSRVEPARYPALNMNIIDVYSCLWNTRINRSWIHNYYYLYYFVFLHFLIYIHVYMLK